MPPNLIPILSTLLLLGTTTAGSIFTARQSNNPPSVPTTSDLYTVKYCITSTIGEPCTLQPISRILYLTQPVQNPSKCEETVGQLGSLSIADLTLPPGKVLYVEATTLVPSQNGNSVTVRPTKKTKQWGTPSVSGKTARFYLADAGQYSVEFVPSSLWRDYSSTTQFDALLLFVDPTLALPPLSVTQSVPASNSPSDPGKVLRTLGPNKSYVFRSSRTYDWGKDVVFRIESNTDVWFEGGSYVRARFVQTTSRVTNVRMMGVGGAVVDNAYPPEEYDVPGSTDDGSRQTIHILGKSVVVRGLTLVNTNTGCGEFGYALNINANWAPIQDPSDWRGGL